MAEDTNTDPPTAPPPLLPWRQSLPLILQCSSHEEEDYDECRRLCRDLLDAAATAAAADQQGGGGSAPSETPPDDVLATVRATYVRSLLHIEDYHGAIEYCRAYRRNISGGSGSGGSDSKSDDDSQNFHLRQEEAYAHYRLGDYVAARDACVSTLKSAGLDPPKDFELATWNGVFDGPIPPIGLLHVYAQSLYRLNETDAAAKVYHFMHEIVLRGNTFDGHDEKDDDEFGEITTNALAGKVANVTYCGFGPNRDALEVPSECEIRRQITSSGDGSYNYDLARNLAQFLIVRATSTSHLHRAVRLLHEAEEGARRMLLLEEEDDDNATESEIAREVAPIKVDLATAYQLLGDRKAASRLYLDLMRGGSSSTSTTTSQQLKFVVGHNLAVMSSSANPAGASKSMPTLKDEEDVTAMNMTPAQIRTVLYNRALLALADRRHEDSREALAELRSAIESSSSAGKGSGGGGKKQKNKKKKGGAASAPSLSAPPTGAADEAIWTARIALVDSEILRAEQKTEEASATILSAINELAALASSFGDDPEDVTYTGGPNMGVQTVHFGLAALSLHRLEVERMAASSAAEGEGDSDDDGTEEKTNDDDAAPALDLIDILSNLPTEIASRRAVRGALSALYSQAGREDMVGNIVENLYPPWEQGGDADSANIKSAHFIRSGRYEDAIAVLRTALDIDDLPEDDHLELTARLAQALSYVDPAEAEELTSSLKDGGEASVLPDGEELEGRETPRLGKGAGAIGRKPGSTADGDGKQTQEKKQKREAALCRRAKKREAYLARLEKDGRYDADRPSKPDPERWIPKAQRSYSRRGRRGRQRFVGAQGGGTGAGADRDAARLDAAARAAAKRDGTAASPSKPSTAHMEVSGGGQGRRKGGRR